MINPYLKAVRRLSQGIVPVSFIVGWLRKNLAVYNMAKMCPN